MSWIITHIEIVAAALLVMLAAIVVLQQRRTPQSTVAWLVAMVAVPYVAVPLFLVMGFRKSSTGFPVIAFKPHLSDAHADNPSRTEHVLVQLGLPAATGGNRVELLTGPVAAYEALMTVVVTAEQRLDVEFYIVDDDPVGAAFVDALAAKASAGVQVRLLLDRFGAMRRPLEALQRLEAAGGDVRYFSTLLQRRAAGHLNLRNHRKLAMADGMRVFAGGMNVAREYMSVAPAPDQWTDLAYLLQGPAVQTCRDVFASNWALAGGDAGDLVGLPMPVVAGDARLQVVASGPDMARDGLHDALVHAIHVANDHVWIATPYFLPTEALSQALILAARRGVEVRLVIPRHSNQKLADFARGAYLREMGEAGAKLMFFESGMMHAKAGVIDGIAYFGSANFDVRSMLLNFELVLFSHDAATVAAVSDWFTTQVAKCKPGLHDPKLARRLLEGFFRLGAPML